MDYGLWTMDNNVNGRDSYMIHDVVIPSLPYRLISKAVMSLAMNHELQNDDMTS